MTSKLTRERIELIANFHRAMTLPPSHDEIEELARIALAAMGSEPVALQPELAKVIYHFRDWNEGFPVERFKADYVISWMLANYPPAQPAPVVPAEKTMPNPLNMYAIDAVAAIAEVRGWNACRAAMLQENPKSAGESNNCRSNENVQDLQASNSPVIGIDPASGPDRSVEVRYVAPPGYVMVPKEPTEDMCFAPDVRVGNKTWDGYQSSADMAECKAIYVAMLAAAPQEVKGE